MAIRIIAALLLSLCVGCAGETGPETATDGPRYITPDTFKTCTLDSCPEQPILSLIMVEPDDTLYTPVKTPIGQVFVTCLGADATPVPEGAIRVTFESKDGVTNRTYDPRSYDWVPVTPDIGYVGMTNISTVEVECTVTYETL